VVPVVVTALALAGCGHSSTPRASAPTRTTASSAPAAPAPVTDQQLAPHVRYVDSSDFSPPVSFEVPDEQWFPYLRGNGALSLRLATGPAESQALGKGIEVVQATGTLPAVLAQLFSSSALRPGPAHPVTIGGQQGRWYDVTIVSRAELAQPESLAGEQVDPAEGLRVYALSGSGTVVLALVTADKAAALPAFLPEASRVVMSLGISR
jgi:hypothetical protein